MDYFKIAVSGSRTLELDTKWMLRTIALFPHLGLPFHILHGDCPRGIDKCVRTLSRRFHVPRTCYIADWQKYGRAAGPIRTKTMLQDADGLIVFWTGDKATSPGSYYALHEAIQMGLPVQEIIVNLYNMGKN